MTDNITSSLKIIEKLFFRGLIFGTTNYLNENALKFDISELIKITIRNNCLYPECKSNVLIYYFMRNNSNLNDCLWNS